MWKEGCDYTKKIPESLLKNVFEKWPSSKSQHFCKTILTTDVKCSFQIIY